LCTRYGVVRMDVFGSTLRDDFRPGESDIDLLVEFSPRDPYELAEAYFDMLDDVRAPSARRSSASSSSSGRRSTLWGGLPLTWSKRFRTPP
jgi:hypothetical protein